MPEPDELELLTLDSNTLTLTTAAILYSPPFDLTISVSQFATRQRGHRGNQWSAACWRFSSGPMIADVKPLTDPPEFHYPHAAPLPYTQRVKLLLDSKFAT